TIYSTIIYLLLSFFFHYYRAHPHLHSFPTRRSSDLAAFATTTLSTPPENATAHVLYSAKMRNKRSRFSTTAADKSDVEKRERLRSEEHTSELQSRGHLVCRLLLEKKKKKSKYI